MQRTIGIAVLGLSVLLAGCANFQPSKPEGYSGPVATVQDKAVAQSASLVHMFYVKAVDERKLRDSGIATVVANQGRGFSISPVVLSHEVPARLTKLQLVGSTMYAAPILAMTGSTCRVEGVVEAVLEAGKTYRVNGSLTREACTVWLESAEGAAVVGQRVTGAGVK